ncbi:MAG: imidazole glycerol phosphate synthase subunit HisH [Bacteroidetes bacterium]|nr:MAG: imidazole glycerol phosphate synthase subunit HisH [Bacteroidota bacterium]
MKLVIVRYNAGNIQSVTYALQRLGIEPVLSDDPEEIRSADKVIFPGVGEAATAMTYLRERQLDEVIISLRQPVLGVCLGLQLMCRHSEERNTTCMGIFPAEVRMFKPAEGIKVPHMGWNLLENLHSPLLEGLGDAPYVYFVHSYYADIDAYTIATTTYGGPFSAVIHKDNFYATQFHPEKSGATGARILQNFLSL